MTISAETQKAITNCYQAMLDAGCKLKNYDVNQEFADFAPNYTVTSKDGNVLTLQQVRSAYEDLHKKRLYKFNTKLSFEQFDGYGDQATVVLFWHYEMVFELPSDVANKLKLLTLTTYEVVKHTWLNTKQGWKLARCHVLHQARNQGQPEYASADSGATEAEKFESELLKARALAAAYTDEAQHRDRLYRNEVAWEDLRLKIASTPIGGCRCGRC